MNLQEAKSEAKYLTEIRQQSHVVIKINSNYFVELASSHNGKYEAKYDYTEKKKKDIQDMQRTTSKKVLPNTGNK